jgi:DNA-directed RNA polymerase specialized sigma24 family protein
MDEADWLAERFDEHRSHLRAVAYRMLGSVSEADDAVQEAWLRLSRADTSSVENLGGWLTRVVARVCLDMLRSRKSRGITGRAGTGATGYSHGVGGRASGWSRSRAGSAAGRLGRPGAASRSEMLEPAERLAFVLHDMFAVPFDEIAPIVGRTPASARQFASRARRRVHGAGRRESEGGRAEANGGEGVANARDADLDRHRAVVDAFLAAARGGDFQGLLTVLDPDVVLRSDAVAVPWGGPQEVRGAEAVAPLAMRGRARAARPVLVNGAVGVVVAPRGRLLMVLDFTIRHGKIDAIADPERLAELELAVTDG